MSVACLNAFVAFLWAALIVLLILHEQNVKRAAWLKRLIDWSLAPWFVSTVVFTVWRVSL